MLDEQWASSTLDATRWDAYGPDYSWNAANQQMAVYQETNVVSGPGASSGATGGTSLRLKVTGSTASGWQGGWVNSKNVGHFLPLFFRAEIRAKLPHGQGLFPALWFTARTRFSDGLGGGAGVAEWDLYEALHASDPGGSHVAWHRLGVSNVAAATPFYEAPTATPDWHVLEGRCEPVSGNPDDLSQGIRLSKYIDGQLVWSYTETDTSWVTSIGTLAQCQGAYWNVYLHGAQVGGTWVGHPDDPLGSSRYLNAGAGGCLSSGTYPSCATTKGGQAIRRMGSDGAAALASADGGPATTLELDYMRVWRYTGVVEETAPAVTDIEYVGASLDVKSSTSVTTATVPVASTLIGDYNLVPILCTASVNATDPGEISAPAGWTVVSSVYDSGSPGVRLTVLGRMRQAGDPATVTLSWSVASSYACTPVAYRGVSAASPVAGQVATAQAVSGTSFSTGQVTTTVPARLVAIAGCRTGGTWTPPAGDTLRAGTYISSSSSCAVSDSGVNSAAGSHTRTWTFTAATSVGAAALVALTEATP